MTELSIPELSLVLLVGVTGSGKSTFARAHFKPTEVISSDFCRGLVADDENDQSATPAAFELLRFIVGQRLKAGRLTVVDATNVQPEARRDLVLVAREYDVLPVAIVLDLPERLCAERNAQRPERDFGPHVVRNQQRQLKRGLRSTSAASSCGETNHALMSLWKATGNSLSMRSSTGNGFSMKVMAKGL